MASIFPTISSLDGKADSRSFTGAFRSTLNNNTRYAIPLAAPSVTRFFLETRELCARRRVSVRSTSPSPRSPSSMKLSVNHSSSSA
jgi:hypothetical protein